MILTFVISSGCAPTENDSPNRALEAKEVESETEKLDTIDANKVLPQPPVTVTKNTTIVEEKGIDEKKPDSEQSTSKPKLYIGVGASLSLIISSDAKNWTSVPIEQFISGLPVYNGKKETMGSHLLAVCAGAKGFAVFGYKRADSGGDAMITLRSDDGVTWQELGSKHYVNSCVYKNGLYVAVGSRILTSMDTVNWVEQPDPSPAGAFQTVTFANDLFFASKAGSTLVSKDGLKWDVLMAAGKNIAVKSVQYGNNLFVGLVDGKFSTSKDGLNWKINQTIFSPNPFSIVFADGQFIATHHFGTGYDMVAGARKSSDAEKWSSVSMNTILHLGNIRYTNGFYFSSVNVPNSLAVLLYYSVDAANWALANVPGAGTIPSPIQRMANFDSY
jgi:hypothetical protein